MKAELTKAISKFFKEQATKVVLGSALSLSSIATASVVPVASAAPVQHAAVAPLAGATVNVWSQYDQIPSLMMRVDDGLCYLSAVHGNFRGGGEVVRIWNQDGYWMLGGQSGQHDVGAVATCIPYSFIQVSVGHSMDSTGIS